MSLIAGLGLDLDWTGLHWTWTRLETGFGLNLDWTKLGTGL